ncbi:MAG: 4Fe-4S dicluster domain-containing protein [Candidatus Aminicenantes bacterium]|nr:4Fe-4S dicluster domain-containing protein [Candidatus Aminicenantes bacterium]NIM78610.1 4Fe-4S dicluster domain-containing protein [Candidatus Aminicenantes bacterium]NIN17855.1 4Fe-4S dicluster domain-containing protein [Candidatus Aminicenantes bacterium]NIN41759.1 4Fe-4S dicluster domain-containing protein [Candidatus Aminicenantes bacterium]NIN84508.1 4Fe-4S dicluster domain-containing protein [Candidatus Aminicenantes bacterium]
MSETEQLKSFIKKLGIDLVGIADLKALKEIPTGLPSPSALESILKNYRYAIVMGVQIGKLGPKASGKDVSMFMEKGIVGVVSFMEEKRFYALPIHTEDEFDPVNRIGLLSLKALANAAGLGWQGRSLLIVSPDHGPLHRLGAVLTNMELQPDQPIENQCGDCSICVEKCPTHALTLVKFDDHPQHREDVLDLQHCLGDDSCPVCIKVCPFISGRQLQNNKKP